MELTIFQIIGPAASVTKSVIKYVEGGGLESDLASIEVEAAKSAFERSRAARKKEDQINGVIYHLQTAEIALQRLVGSRSKRYLKPFPWYENLSDLLNVRIFMASCYIYLEEYELGLTMLDQAEDCFRLKKIGDETLTPAAPLNFAYYATRSLMGIYLDVSPGIRMYTNEDIERKIKPTIRNLRKAALSQKSFTKNLLELFK